MVLAENELEWDEDEVFAGCTRVNRRMSGTRHMPSIVSDK